MKKKILLGLFTLSTVVLSGCANSAPVESQVTKNLNVLRKGVSLVGKYTQTRVFYTDGNFDKVQDMGPEADLKAEASIQFGFTPDAFYRNVATIMEGETIPYVEDIYVKDEDGYAYKEYLSYENKVEKKYQMSYGNKSSFVNLGYGNPFDKIYETDLTYNEKTKQYSLDLNKASEMFVTLLNFYAAGIVNTGASCLIDTNANGEFTNLTYVLTPRKVAEYNSMANTTSYYITDQKIELVIETIEDVEIVKRLEPIQGTESSQINQLKKAFNNFNGNNVQITVKDAPQDGNETFKKFWYDDSVKSVYVKQYNSVSGGDLNERNPEFDYILSPNEKANDLYEARGFDEKINKWVPSNNTKFGKTSQDKYSYSDLIFDLSKVSTDLFVYSPKDAAFVCENVASGDVALKGLQPKAKELQNNNLQYADKITIKVADDKISKITAHYSYYNYFTAAKVEGEVTFTFRTSGTTKLPFGAQIENIGGNK